MPRTQDNFRGFLLNIENPEGTVRKGHGWRTLMRNHYGEIPNTLGPDGDPIDVFIQSSGPITSKIFAIHQRDPRTGDYDEDKLILGEPDAHHARAVYDQHYDMPEAYFQGITEWTPDELAKVLAASKGNPGKLDSINKVRWLRRGRRY